MILPTPDRPFVVVCVRPGRVPAERLWQRFATLAEAERVAAQLNSVRCPAAVRTLDAHGGASNAHRRHTAGLGR